LQFLFIHQNIPGQFIHLAAHLAKDSRNRVVFLTKRSDRGLPGVERVVYATARAAHPHTHHYLHQYEDAVLHGQATVRACLELRQQGFIPDLVVAHPGWGESLFLKEVWPKAPLLNYGEFYYRACGADVNFDPEFPSEFDAVCKLRARCAHLLLALEAADHTICPTHWQKSLHPAEFYDRISVIFDGVDTDTVTPDAKACFALPDGRVLTQQDEVVSYVSRNLEPLRGFHTFMRALPRLCSLRPRAEIVIVGSDERGYGVAAPPGKTWRQAMLDEVEVDRTRVHFAGVVDYPAYLNLLRVSSAHVYLTVPFVLSWSMVEAMAAGCLVIASRTPPVEEVIEPGLNGLLVDFFRVDELADTVALALAERRGLAALRRAARETVLQRYSLTATLPQHRALIETLVGGPVSLATASSQAASQRPGHALACAAIR
jgi:glycosyltransferase involved in cell wall biosynthesis